MRDPFNSLYKFEKVFPVIQICIGKMYITLSHKLIELKENSNQNDNE